MACSASERTKIDRSTPRCLGLPRFLRRAFCIGSAGVKFWSAWFSLWVDGFKHQPLASDLIHHGVFEQTCISITEVPAANQVHQIAPNRPSRRISSICEFASRSGEQIFGRYSSRDHRVLCVIPKPSDDNHPVPSPGILPKIEERHNLL